MASPLTLRLDDKTRQRIARIARRRGLSVSEVVRRAIEASVEREDPAVAPYEVIKDLIGAVHTGSPKLSQQTGRSLTKLLKDRQGARRKESGPR
jgi:predicted DNA-binding protein